MCAQTVALTTYFAGYTLPNGEGDVFGVKLIVVCESLGDWVGGLFLQCCSDGQRVRLIDALVHINML